MTLKKLTLEELQAEKQTYEAGIARNASNSNFANYWREMVIKINEEIEGRE